MGTATTMATSEKISRESKCAHDQSKMIMIFTLITNMHLIVAVK